MSLRRVQKVAEAIREVVSMSILTELQDPRVRDVTVTGVEASGDLRYAKVMVSVMGDETRQKLTLRGLQSAAGFLQSKIAERIDLRYTPKLTFVLDLGVKHSIAVAQILREVLPDEQPEAAEAVSGEAEVAGEAEAAPAEDGAANLPPLVGPVDPPLPSSPSSHIQP
jgi:ribosome-binding factor A